MKPIPVTEFTLPNGRRTVLSISFDDDVADIAKEIIARGGRLTTEVLRTGQRSNTIELDGKDYDIRVSKNDTAAMLQSFIDMLRKFDSAEYDKVQARKN